MRGQPYNPNSAPDQLEAHMNYMTQKLILLWRADPQRAHAWLMARDRVVRLFLVAVIREIAIDEDTVSGLKQDCREIITYLKSKL